MTEFQRKTYEKTINHIFSFVPDEDGITGTDIMNIIQHCVKTMPDNELDALFDMSKVLVEGEKLSKRFPRERKEYAVGMALLNIILKNAKEDQSDGQK